LILVDTSVWIDHLHRSIAFLGDALESGDVLVHPFIIGELACGEIKGRRDFLGLLATLPASVVATDEETLHFIERHRLMGKGIGYIDAHLLASVTLTDGAQLWTRDSRLRLIAAKLALSVEPS
jgi:predicted nucleic acid-binding protein